MSNRTDLPKIKPTEEPSILNHEAGKWGWLAGIGAAFAAIPYMMSRGVKEFGSLEAMNRNLESAKMVPLFKKTALFILGAELVGATMGGLSGKEKQEQEQREGRTVVTPGYWNKGIISGLLVSGLIQAPFSYAKLNAGTIATKVGLWPAVVSGLAVSIGSSMRKNSLQRDFDKAVAIRDQEQAQLKAMVQSATKEKEPTGYKNTVTTDEAANLNAKQNPSASHVEKHEQAAAETEVPQRA